MCRPVQSGADVGVVQETDLMAQSKHQTQALAAFAESGETRLVYARYSRDPGRSLLVLSERHLRVALRRHSAAPQGK